MHIFVASWFFPPNSSSEGFVTWKLLRNSAHEYDVVCSTSHKWGYSETMQVSEPNINIHPVETDDLRVWVSKAVEMFEALHAEWKYDAVMTRSMPPEAVEVGREIKRRHPEVKWIASFGDPIANNPYSMAGIEENGALPRQDVLAFLEDMALTCDRWRRDWAEYSDASIRYEAGMRVLQDAALDGADMIICPVLEQMEYMISGRAQKKPFFVVPHAYDESLYQDECNGECPVLSADRVNLVYLGYSDARRSLLPVVRALRDLQRHYPQLAAKICLHVFGNYPHCISDYVNSYQMPRGLVAFHGNCSYEQSLYVMKHADWLLHIDAFFGKLQTGGSIFLAGKLADYLGAGKPILAVTGQGSPAFHVVKNYGGIICQTWDELGLLNALMQIAGGKSGVAVDMEVRGLFDARNAAAMFDSYLVDLFVAATPVDKLEVHASPAPQTEKLLTICVPCYNGAATLERCLDSVLGIKSRDALEVIVVDDGSKDRSAEIAQRYVDRYPGIVTLIRKPNGGHGSGVNVGMEHGKGLYYRVLDADDWMDSCELQRLIEYFASHRESPVDVCYTNYHVVNAKDGSTWPWPQPQSVEYGRIYRFEELDVNDVYFTMHGSSFLLETLRKSGVKCHEHCFYVDSEYILKPIPFVKTAVFLDLYIYKYWQGQEGQSVSAASFVRNYENHATVMKSLVEYFNSTEMPPAQKLYFRRLLKEHLKTHYHIIRDLDPDRSRARSREKEFDDFLRHSDRELYLWNKIRLCRPVCMKGVGDRLKVFFKKVIKALLPYGVVKALKKLKGGA